ncbi:helix-turn-helix transcriptional regulator [Micromonospora sp. NPDC126480]|uniref:helix-turn-helix transcriptional regulator n=1 Tax=Micromonospora sp. NPDC126480 TaxID=3155312 RepID=UPI0033237B18
MARIANFSTAYFNQMFCSVVGVPPSRYLTALRLDAAKRLLVQSDLRVADICFQVGYNSLGTFSSRFTQMVGISPYRFRALSNSASWPTFDQLVQLTDRSFPPVFHSHKQISAGTVRVVRDGNAVHGSGGDPRPVFVGLYRQAIPQGEPVAHTIVLGSSIYLLPAVPDGRYHVFAVSFPWSTEPRSNLLLDPASGDVLVASGDRPLRISNGRLGNHVDLVLRPVEPTDPPLLTAVPHLLLRSRKTPPPLLRRSAS